MFESHAWERQKQEPTPPPSAAPPPPPVRRAPRELPPPAAAIMDFPDLGAAVEAPKRERMPPRKKQGSAAGGERGPKSALQSMVEGRSENGNGTTAGRAHDKQGAASAASADALPVEVLADIGPPPKAVAEPDAAAHQEAAAAIQARIDEGEKRVVCFLSTLHRALGGAGD